ncbi:MAG TPA: DUF3943 domain-containing protein [Gemmatimonadales bacterium]|nr:DUF3943 domain-containing protein [Gemmatimonadales bacterium]
MATASFPLVQWLGSPRVPFVGVVRNHVLVLVALVGLVRPVSAQGHARGVRADTVHQRTRPVRALGELFIVQLIPFSINYVVRDKEWAKVTLQSWEENLENPWAWDNDHFIANQFSHPYHGNLYFNAARTNGYGFWASVPWAYGGSAMWELFGEQFAPSANDLLNTGTGGITLGESLYRLSSLVLDNQATGSERTWREIFAALLDPVRGFNRLLDGEVSGRRPNPPDWRPSHDQGVLDVGYRRIAVNNSFSGSRAADQAVAEFHLVYGDLANDIRSKPFSHFEFDAELSDKASQGERGRLSLLTARGSLGGIELSHSATARHTLGALLTYEFYNNPAFEYGGQSVYGGLISEFRKGDDKDGKKVRATTEVLLQGIIIGATLSEHYYAGEGRNYDYGMGLGTRLAASFVKPGRGLVRLGWGGHWLHTLHGAESAHYQGGAFFEARFFPLSKFGLGASYYNYERKTDYTGFPQVTQTSPMLNFFVSTAIPSLTP